MDTAADPSQEEAIDAARARVAALLESLSRVDLQVAVASPPDATRLAARDRGRAAASVAGRGPLLDEAMTAARSGALRSFANAGFSGTWAATDMAVSVARASDRVAAASAFEEAAMAAVVEDLVDDDTLEVLRSTADDLVSLRGVPAPGSLATLGSSVMPNVGPLQTALGGAIAISLAVVGFVVAGVPGAVGLVIAFVVVAGSIQRRSKRGP